MGDGVGVRVPRVPEGLRWDSAAPIGEVIGIPNTWNKQHVHGSVMGVREARCIWTDK